MSQITPSVSVKEATNDSAEQHPVVAVAKKSRRGRRSNVPPEQREHVRRLKKQNMERRRRACIADKMNALHSLAMNLIGEDPAQYQKAEKADLLNMCYNVFEHLVTIVNDEPDIRSRVQRTMEQTRERITTQFHVPSTASSPSHTHPMYDSNKENQGDFYSPQTQQPHHELTPLSTTFSPLRSSGEQFSLSHLHTPIQRLPGGRFTGDLRSRNSSGHTMPSSCSSNEPQISADSGLELSDPSVQPYSICNLTGEMPATRPPLSDSRGNSTSLNRSSVWTKVDTLSSRRQGKSTSVNHRNTTAPTHSTPLWRPYLD